jgi:hypothetical protein
VERNELREKVLEKTQRTLGSQHPHTLAAMNNLAISYSEVERRQEAMELTEGARVKAEDAGQRTSPHSHCNEQPWPIFQKVGETQ